MSYILFDPDEWESVGTSTPCTACGNGRPCNGRCNGSASFEWRMRSSEAIAKIKADKRAEHERAVLAEADAIRARRA